MAVDLRHWAWCSLGPLAPVEAAVTLADDHIQGRGVCMTKGTVILQGIHRPNMGDPVSVAYGNGAYLARVPRRLRVLSSFADPLARTTTVSVGCLLALFENRRPPVENPTEAEENASLPDVVRRVAATSMSAAWVIGKILTGLGITAASAVPFNFHRVVDEWDLSAGYVEELGRICDSARHFCRINEAEQLEFISKDESDDGPAPLITAAEILSLQPVNVGELPGDAVYAKFTSLKLVPPDPNLSESERAKRNWEREEVNGGPVQSIHSYTDAGGQLVKQFITFNDWSLTETTYDNRDRVTRRQETANTINGIRQTVTTFDYGVTFIPPGTPSTDDGTDYSDVRREVSEEYGPVGDIAAACGRNGPIASFRTGTTLKSWRVTTYDKEPVSGITKTTTQQAVLYINTPFGADAISKLREEGEPVEELIGYASRLTPYGSSTRIRTEREFGLQKRPGQQERNRLASAKVPTVEETTSATWAVGSPTSETAVELSPPYVSDDRIVASGSPVVYTVVRADAQQQALAYARTENHLRLGNRNGAGLQLGPLDCPARPFSPFFVRLNGCTARYRTNGTTWTIGTGGVAITTDALFRGAIDGTLADAWFPLPPGVTTLPAAGTVTTNANPRPANYMAVPGGFNPQNPDLVALFAALPTAVAAIPRATLSPASLMIRPWRETVRLRGGVRVGGRIRELPPGPQGETLRGGVRVGGRVHQPALIVQPARAMGRGMVLTLTSEDPVGMRITPAKGAGQGMPLTLTSGGTGSLSLVTTRAGLSGTDFLDWGQLGAQSYDELTQPISATSDDGLGVTVTASHPLLRVNEDGFWAGNFAAGDALIAQDYIAEEEEPLPISLVFASAITAVGAQVQAGYAGPYTAKIEVFAGASSLGSFTVSGTAASNPPPSAVFIGARSGSANITRVEFSVTAAEFDTLGYFAINRVELA